MAEEVLQEDPHRRVIRIGDTVRRPVQPWSPAVHTLLLHLEAVGFPYAPRFLGLDEHGREVLTYIEGESGPLGWAKVIDDAGLVRFADLLRHYHDAVATFVPPAGTRWFTGTGTATGDGTGLRTGGLPPGTEVICHGDFGPWNIVWLGDEPAAMIDWDLARPAPRLHDVAYALEYCAPFRDDTDCARWLRHREPPDRRHRIEVFAAAYGLTSTAGLVDAVIAVQRDSLEQVRRLAAAGRQPQVDWVAAGQLNELRSRVTWSEAHRHLFQ